MRITVDRITLEELLQHDRGGSDRAAWSGDEAEDLRRRSHVEHLVESAKLTVRAAGHTSRQIEDRVRRRQRA